MDNIKRLAISVIVAAIGCAGCVGWSFLQKALAAQQQNLHTPAVTVSR
jgi:hypothetical protein